MSGLAVLTSVAVVGAAALRGRGPGARAPGARRRAPTGALGRGACALRGASFAPVRLDLATTGRLGAPPPGAVRPRKILSTVLGPRHYFQDVVGLLVY
ncbi:hypothetical protein GCM10017687_79750 [Streptomyces echinatus]